MKLRPTLLSLLALCLIPIPALAQNDLYDNGPTNGTTDAWEFDSGLAVSDQFTLNSAGQVNGLQFAVWIFPGDVLQGLEVLITSQEFGGTVYFDGNLTPTQSGCAVNENGWNVCNENVTFSPVNLNAGSYWLTLQNGFINPGDPVYWDENSGPSLASQNSIGTIPSESFTVLGSASSTTTTGTTPEPGTLTLFGSSALGLLSILHRKLGR